MKKRKISITVIVAAYNEEEKIENVLTLLYKELIRHNEIDCEILAYNDESTDKTGEIIDSLSKKYKKIIPVHNKQNLGLGGIMNDAIKQSKKKKIMLLPGDGQFKIKEIAYLIKNSADTDILLSFHKNYYIRTLWRRLLSYSFHKIIKICFSIPYKYLNWINIYNLDIFKQVSITSERFAFGAEIIIKAHKLGYKIKEIGSELKDRDTGHSSATRVTSIFKAAMSVFKIWVEVYIKNRKKYVK